MGDKSIHMNDDMFMNLEPGEYFIRMRVMWETEKYREGVLAAYAPEAVSFQQHSRDAGTRLVLM